MTTDNLNFTDHTPKGSNVEKKTIYDYYGQIEDTFNFDFGDKRINKRANLMINRMENNLEKTMPNIFTSNDELQAAYRFLRNDLVTPPKLLEPHRLATLSRIQNQKLVCVLQDSSDLSFDHMVDLVGYNELHASVQKGLRIHPQVAVSEQGTPLGVMHSLAYTRSEKDPNKKNRRQLPIEQKESYRWLEGVIKTCELAKECPNTIIVSIADREGDIFDLFEQITDSNNPENAHLIVRQTNNRYLDDYSIEFEAKLEQKLTRCPIVYDAKIVINPSSKNERTANVAIRATSVMLKVPVNSVKKGRKPVQMNAVMVSEIDPPNDCDPLYWVLLTTLDIDNADQIRKVVKLYGLRWTIEVFFKCLKSGCKIDSLFFQSTNSIENYIAMAMIVAWKTMLATYLPREFPEAPCNVMFTDLEWKLVYLSVYKKKRPLPEKAPNLREVTALIAELGGYIKRREPPGMQTIWRGISRLVDIVDGYELAQEVKKEMLFNV